MAEANIYFFEDNLNTYKKLHNVSSKSEINQIWSVQFRKTAGSFMLCMSDNTKCFDEIDQYIVLIFQFINKLYGCKIPMDSLLPTVAICFEPAIGFPSLKSNASYIINEVIRRLITSNIIVGINVDDVCSYFKFILPNMYDFEYMYYK